MINLKKFVALGIASFLVGCGNSNSGRGDATSLQNLNGSEYVVLPGSTLNTGVSSIRGTGRIIFRAPLVDPDNNYALKFKLDAQGSLCLVSQTDREMQGGVRLCFTRLDSQVLKVELKAGTQLQDKSADFASVSPLDELSFSIDIHGHGHLVIWNGDSEHEYPFSGLKGTLWGVELQNATLTSAVQGAPREKH